MTAQCSDPFSVSHSARMDYCAVKKTRCELEQLLASYAVAADVRINVLTTFSPLMKPHPIENHVPEHSKGENSWGE